MSQIVLATKNQGKILEFQRLLSKHAGEVKVLGLSDFPDLPDVEESGKTLSENAKLKAKAKGHIATDSKPLAQSVAAVSVGIVNGKPTLDLCYEEDVSAETDMNIVCTGDGNFIEVQGTAEGAPFDRNLLNLLLDLGAAGCAELTKLQLAALSK